MNFFVISLRKNFLTIVFVIFLVCLLGFSSSNLVAAQEGLALWATTVLPSLFPFFIATELLCRTNFVYIIGRLLNKIMRPIFNVPGESATALLLGTISGYPVGAKVVCNLKKQKVLSKAEAERLIAYTNNSGPLFILGSVGIALLGNKQLGFILLISHILASLLVGYCFQFWKKDSFRMDPSLFYEPNNQIMKISDLGEILGDSIKSAISTVLTIGGFVVLFSVIISILETSGIFYMLSSFFSQMGIPEDFSLALFSGILELTNGVKLSTHFYHLYPTASILLTSFLLGFGGCSVLLQIYSIIAKEGISIKPYIYGKFLQGLFSVCITFALLSIF